MNEFFMQSSFVGVIMCLAAFLFGRWINQKTKLPFLNPLLIAIVIIAAFLVIFHVDYEAFNYRAKYVNYLITPATVALAVPLYKQIALLKKHIAAIMISLGIGTFTGLLSIYVMSTLFGLSHEMYVTLLPKSITTAVGMSISEQSGGIVTITVVTIIITGILGAIIAEPIYKIFKIKNSIAKGLGLGASSHVIGTSKAMTMDEECGAMSSLSIVVCSIITVIAASFMAELI